MAELGFELFLRFLWGSALIIFWISRKETSERFLKVAFWIAVGCFLTAGYMAYAAWFPQESSFPIKEILSVPGGVFQRALLSLLFLICGLALYSFFSQILARSLGFFVVLCSPFFMLHPLSNPAGTFNFISSSLLLGSVFMAQFLGHWYLNVPNLHIRELARVVQLMFLSIGLKILELSWTLFHTVGLHPLNTNVDFMGRPMGLVMNGSQSLELLSDGEGLFALQGDIAFGLGSYGILLLVTRILWGVLAPMLLGGMVYQTVQVRATQSATGILYAMCVMILIGESAAIFFKNTLGLHL